MKNKNGGGVFAPFLISEGRVAKEKSIGKLRKRVSLAVKALMRSKMSDESREKNK